MRRPRHRRRQSFTRLCCSPIAEMSPEAGPYGPARPLPPDFLKSGLEGLPHSAPLIPFSVSASCGAGRQFLPMFK